MHEWQFAFLKISFVFAASLTKDVISACCCGVFDLMLKRLQNVGMGFGKDAVGNFFEG
jgi:hypothetical protein